VLSISAAMNRPASAVILADRAQRNITPPKGTLLNSGWQWEGKWGPYLGTAISKFYFITAEHIGGSVGDSFTLNGVNYKTVATYDDPNSDLQMWKVDKPFSTWATMYKSSNEKGMGIVTFGRGTQRGGEVNVNGQLKGWLWGTDDHVQSWGKNVIGGLATDKADDGTTDVTGGRFFWTFDNNRAAYEGSLSTGDSGGGVFMKVGKSWRLVGVNHSTEAEFRYPNDSPPGTFMGSLFDVGGLMTADGDLIQDTARNNPSKSYATRISLRQDWIYDVVSGHVASSPNPIPGSGVPEPTSAGLMVGCAWAMIMRRRQSR